MLESLESETPNIKDLNIESEPKPELLFDPEKEITQEDWELMVSDLDKTLKSYQEKYEQMTIPERRELLEQYANDAANMKILFPKRFDSLTISNDRLCELYVDAKRNFRNDPKAYLDLELASIKIINPKIISPIDLGNKYQRIVDSLKTYVIGSGGYRKLKILFPHRDIVKELFDPEWEFQSLPSRLDKFRESNYYDSFIADAASVKVLFPDHDITSLISEEDMRQTRDMLEECRRFKNGHTLARLAANLKILSASKVEVTKNGLELTMSEDFATPDVPPLPQQRSF